MHRIATLPGGWNPDLEGVIFVDQTPGDIVLITAADTDIQTLAAIDWPEDFPVIRAVNILQLQQQLTIDTYAETVLSQAKLIIVRLLGGVSYWPYGLEVTAAVAATLIVIPGDNRLDPLLISHSSVDVAIAEQVWRYFTEGGISNLANCFQFLAHKYLAYPGQANPPQPVPKVGILASTAAPQVAVIFYRAHYLAGNTAAVIALCQALAAHNLRPLPVYVSSLRDQSIHEQLLKYLAGVGLILNTTSFTVGQTGTNPLTRLGVPILQVIFSGGTKEAWQESSRGLNPRDMAMHVVLPEVDGKVITRAVAFKAVQTRHEMLQTDVVVYETVSDRLEFVAQLAANYLHLQQTPASDRRIALVLANYPSRDGRLANGVGLDTPASCVAILHALRDAGYSTGDLPANGAELIAQLTGGITNDPEGRQLRPGRQVLPLAAYQAYLKTLPVHLPWELPDQDLPIAGCQFGNIFVGIQPSRGQDPSLSYHSPDLAPPHDYLGFYHWLRQNFAAQAIVHVGKHGNLEWLPGKSIALSRTCYPEIALGPLPHFYLFIVNDPGEGCQAKRRSQAVILDHLTPPMTRAELYGELLHLEALVDEYYQAEALDPSRLGLLREQITGLIEQNHLQQELGAIGEFTEFLNRTDSYLCDLKEAQIRNGLHVFGQCPAGVQLRDLIVAIARCPRPGYQGLTRAIAQDWGLDLDPLTADPTAAISFTPGHPLAGCRNLADAIAAIEAAAARLVEQVLNHQTPDPGPATNPELTWITQHLIPSLQSTDQEITNLLRGLAGQYIPSGPSGAPTRGRPEVLPTGRNFYAVDTRALPTQSAWQVGRQAAELVVERYCQENGEYPRSLALSVWGTATMRTGGDDIAQALAFLGVTPVWDGGRVVDFAIVPLSVLGRPRVDVTLRISGFFRDAFANLIDLFDQAVMAVASLDEPVEDNPIRAQVEQDYRFWLGQGLAPEPAQQRSLYRIFGAKPGAYGTGLQELIESQAWQTQADLAEVFLDWGSYAYTGKTCGAASREALVQRLQNTQIVLQNQDNREHDLLDSDDYYQFQGGLTVAVQTLSGQTPAAYFGDHALAENPKLRSLGEEIAKVYRSRVINPKWIAGAMRHGYKGAFEMSATIDFLFAYGATTNCVPGHMYQGVAQAYLFDQAVYEFMQAQNPWAARDMAERLLEAQQRGIWRDASPETTDRLRAIALEAEAIIEGKSG
jgi:cobaltochelatase CobN